MCNGKCPEEDMRGECNLLPFDPSKCTLELLWDGDIGGDYDIPLELRVAVKGANSQEASRLKPSSLGNRY